MSEKIYSADPIYIQNIEDTEKYALSKQKFSYNCEMCGKLEIRNLYYYFNIYHYKQLLCKECLTKVANQKRQKTCIKKYGADNIRKSEKYKEYCKKLHLQNYGVENVSQAKEIKDKKEKMYLKHFGVKNPTQSEKIKEKTKQTCLQKYGVEKFAQQKDVKKYLSEKAKQRMQNGGSEHLRELWKDPERKKKLSEKVSKTWLQKSPKEIKEIRRKASKKYQYQNEQFDSSWELAFYIWCKDHNKNILRETQSFSFNYNGESHYFIPDFEVDGNLYEIKGDQFLAENDTWKDPFNTHRDSYYEAKHQCALENNVKILYHKDIKKCVDYINEKYGKDYLIRFRNK